MKNADFDGNGIVDSVDSSLVISYIMSDRDPSFIRNHQKTDNYTSLEGRGDVNGDGIVDFRDHYHILRYYAKLNSLEPEEDYFINISKLPKSIDKKVTISQSVANANINKEYNEFVLNFSSNEPVCAVAGRLLFNGKPISEAKVKDIEIRFTDKEVSWYAEASNGLFFAYLSGYRAGDSGVVFRIYGGEPGEYTISYDDLKFYGTDFAEYSGYTKKDFSPYITLVDEPVRALGDIDGNGILDAVDASKILASYAKYSTGQAVPSDEDKAVCDVNKDGFIDSVDASKVLSFYAYVSTGGKDSFEKFVGIKE